MFSSLLGFPTVCAVGFGSAGILNHLELYFMAYLHNILFRNFMFELFTFLIVWLDLILTDQC